MFKTLYAYLSFTLEANYLRVGVRFILNDSIPEVSSAEFGFFHAILRYCPSDSSWRCFLEGNVIDFPGDMLCRF